MFVRKTLLVVLFLLPIVVLGQSLGDVAKKEKKRRAENQEKDVQVRVVNEDEIDTEEEEESTEAEPDSPVAESESETLRGTSSASDRQREESEWRRRIGEARERLSAARKRYDYFNNLHLSHGEYYVDENGQPAITSLAQLRRLVGEAKVELDAATEAMEKLREDARRAGVPSGWFR